MLRTRSLVLSLLLLITSLPAASRGDEPFRFPEGKHGEGELKYVRGVPVLTVEGTPQEIGEQLGVLALKPAPQMINVLREFIRDRKLEKAWPLLVRICDGLFANFPAEYRAELESMVKASGMDRDGVVVGNTIMDYAKLGGCSTLLVEPGRSRTKGPLFGRNFDFPPVGRLYQDTLVIVYRPRGKHAFAAVTFPGVLAGPSMVNDAGLAVAVNEMTAAADGSSRFDPRGMPLEVLLRRLVEECATVEEAEKFLRAHHPTTMLGLTVCDTKTGAVFEVTTKNVKVRRPAEGLCACTNHFRCEGLAGSTKCRRYDTLQKARDLPRLGVADVARQMHAVHQGAWTLHTMVFEPAALRLHLAFGKGPSSALPLAELDLTPFLRKGRAAP